MNGRRNFLASLPALGLSSALLKCPLGSQITKDSSWAEIKQQYYTPDSGYINYNTGSSGVMPMAVYQAYTSYLHRINAYAPYEILGAEKENILRAKTRLRDLVNASNGDIAIVRNTTEAINMVLNCLRYEAGDEIILANIDYPFVINTVNHKAKLEGLKVREVEINVMKDSDTDIIQKYSEAISSKTRLLVLTHMTHREGHILPIKKIVELAKQNNIEVLVDGAHVVGQIPCDLADLGCDYYASSLHKWLSAPLGTGMLYVDHRRISKLSGVLSYFDKVVNDIEKFEHIGTRAFQNLMTINSCLDFLEAIVLDRKRQRLDDLKNYAIQSLAGVNGVVMRSIPEKTCGVFGFRSDSIRTKRLRNELMSDHGLHVKIVSQKGEHSFIRVSMNLHLDESDVDRLVSTVKTITA